jgi:DNA polymerase-3 subunit beta
MKLTVSKDAILDGLQKVQSVVSTRSTLQVLYNVHLKAEKDTLWLTTTDLEVTVRTSVPARVSRTGGTTLPARRTFSIFKELPTNDIEIDVDDRNVASVRSGASFFKIIGISEDDFPGMPKLMDARGYALEQKVFKTMLQAVHYAASQDDMRPMLNGVLLSFRAGKCSAVATDARRMALWEHEMEIPHEQEGEWIVPSKTINELLKLLKDDGEIKIQMSNKQAAFEFDSIRVVSKLVDQIYPNYRQVMPQGAEQRITLEREEFLNAIRRVALLLTDRSASITLTFTKNNLELSAAANDVGEAKERMGIRYSGKDIAIAFNPEFLMDPLRNVDAKEVVLELNNEMSPCVIKADKPFVYVIMPVRLK